MENSRKQESIWVRAIGTCEISKGKLFKDQHWQRTSPKTLIYGSLVLNRRRSIKKTQEILTKYCFDIVPDHQIDQRVKHGQYCKHYMHILFFKNFIENSEVKIESTELVKEEKCGIFGRDKYFYYFVWGWVSFNHFHSWAVLSNASTVSTYFHILFFIHFFLVEFFIKFIQRKIFCFPHVKISLVSF